jgi:D-alanine-D-alanine ligase-like ATP-grasp enzyme
MRSEISSASYPETIALFYEERDVWRNHHSQMPLASEAVRWLAPQEELQFVAHLIENASMNVLHLPLGRMNPTDIISKVLSRRQSIMTWNVTDGLINFQGSLVPAMAELLDIPSFGSPSYVQGVCQNKHHWKSIVAAQGIPVLPGAVIQDGSSEEYQRIANLRPPFFVKTATYGNNAGFDVVDPLANTPAEAMRKAGILINGGLSPILIEEYASGFEYSAWLLKMGQNWSCYLYRRKMNAPYLSNAIKDNTSIEEQIEIISDNRIEDMSRRLVRILGIKDYVRIDFRTTIDNAVVPIDINTGAFFSGGSLECLFARSGGINSAFQKLIQCSWHSQIQPDARHNRDPVH